MKFLMAFLPALLAIVSANTCEDCTAVVNTLATYLTTEESMGKQVEILLAKICPGAEDSDGCVTGLPEFWKKIAMMLWPGYYNPEEPFMCAKDDICGAPGAKLAMTCDECVGGINASVDQLLSEEFIAGIVEWLSGVEFCGVDEDPEMCANIIHQLIPAALPALAAGFDPENASDICNKAVSDTCIGKESESRVERKSDQIRYELARRSDGDIDLQFSDANNFYWPNAFDNLRVKDLANQILPSIDQQYRKKAEDHPHPEQGKDGYVDPARWWQMIIGADDTRRLVALYSYKGNPDIAANDPRIQAGQVMCFEVHFTVPPMGGGETHFTFNIWIDKQICS